MEGLKVGSKAIWKPRTWDGKNWIHSEKSNHPWYGHTVTILYVPENTRWLLYKFHVDDAPRTNDPHHFDFWDDADTLEPIEEANTEEK